MLYCLFISYLYVSKAGFGNNFLTKFEGAEVNAAILNNITIIDTPGVLAGEKQRIGRDYDFSEIVKWFAERADMILIMFDAHKLDISDELKTVLDALKPHQDKMRILLNKSDTIDARKSNFILNILYRSLVSKQKNYRGLIASIWCSNVVARYNFEIIFHIVLFYIMFT